jgi:hypothetical protein
MYEEKRYLLAAKGLVSGRILDVSSRDEYEVLIKKDHEPSDAEIDYAEDFFGTERFEFFTYEE